MQSYNHVVSNEMPQTPPGAQQLMKKYDLVTKVKYFHSLPDIHLLLNYLDCEEHNKLAEFIKYDPTILEKSHCGWENKGLVDQNVPMDSANEKLSKLFDMLDSKRLIKNDPTFLEKSHCGRENKSLVDHNVPMDSANEKLLIHFGLLDSKRIQSQTNEKVQTKFDVNTEKIVLTYDIKKTLEEIVKNINENPNVSNIHVHQMKIIKKTLENVKKQIMENSIDFSDISEDLILDNDTSDTDCETEMINKTLEDTKKPEEHFNGDPNIHPDESLIVFPDISEDLILDNDTSDTDCETEIINKTLGNTKKPEEHFNGDPNIHPDELLIVFPDISEDLILDNDTSDTDCETEMINKTLEDTKKPEEHFNGEKGINRQNQKRGRSTPEPTWRSKRLA